MSGPGQGPLPTLTVADFAPGQPHVARAFVQDKVFAILRGDDPALPLLPNLSLAPGDPYLYLFVHGGDEATRFQNWVDFPSHEIPVQVVTDLLANHYGNRLCGAKVRLCACYGNLIRPGDPRTIAQLLAHEVPQAAFEGYHGLVMIRGIPPAVALGFSVVWDPQVGPVLAGLPGNWEPIIP